MGNGTQAALEITKATSSAPLRDGGPARRLAMQKRSARKAALLAEVEPAEATDLDEERALTVVIDHLLSSPEMSALVASQLLNRLGSTSAILNASQAELYQVAPRIATGLFALFQSVRTIGLKLDPRFDNRPVLSTTGLIADYLTFRLGSSQRALVVCLFLNNDNRLIEYHEHSVGTVDRVNVYPREIVIKALSLNIMRVVVACRRAGESVKLTASDIDLARSIRETFALVDIRLCDYVLVGQSRCICLSDYELVSGV